MKPWAAAALLALASPAAAQTGYVRLIAAGQDLGYHVPGAVRRSAFTGFVGRLMVTVDATDFLRLEAHSRLQGLARSEANAAGVLGFGVSTVARRAADLSVTIASGDHGSLVHDVDRLSATVRLPYGDVIVGRQAITWGLATLFPVADLWAQLSPFELDTEHKPGSDAVRALIYPTGALELDLVVADRGPARDVSVGARATARLAAADVYLAGGKFWDRWRVLGGFALVTGNWKFRAEASAPEDPRVTVGADRIGTSHTVSIEYHYNGLGSTDPADYAAVIASPAFQRGETYFAGRHLAGAVASWLHGDRWTFALGNLVNLTDPSVAWLPSVTWDAGQWYRLILGGLVSFGAHPSVTVLRGFEPESEFGTYGRFAYLQAALYW